MKKSINVPNLAVKSATKIGLSSAKHENNYREAKSRFLQETATYANRLEISKEQIIKNKLKAINSPKNFVTGKVTESIFTDFNKKPAEDDEEEWKKIQMPKYQIVPKGKPIKVLNNIQASDDYNEHCYIPIQERTRGNKQKDTKSTRSTKYMTPQRK